MGVSFNMWCLKNHKNIERKIIVKNNGSEKKINENEVTNTCNCYKPITKQ